MRTQLVRFSAKSGNIDGKDVTEFDLDEFYAQLVNKTSILQTISSVIGMDQFTPQTVISD